MKLPRLLLMRNCYFLKKFPSYLCYCSLFPKREQVSLPGSLCLVFFFNHSWFQSPAFYATLVGSMLWASGDSSTFWPRGKYLSSTALPQSGVSSGTLNVCFAWPAQCLTKSRHFLNTWRFCKKKKKKIWIVK